MAKLGVIRWMAAMAAILFLASANPGFVKEAEAADFTWRIKSSHENVVSLKFYSQSRNGVWPGSDEVYILDDSDVHNFALSCRSGEKICFGAWVRNRSERYWGVGQDDEEGCTGCCYTCRDGGRSEIINLVE